MRKIIQAMILATLLLAAGAACLAAPADNEQLFPVKNGRLAGFIDVNGRLAVPLLFADVSEYAEGLAAVKDTVTGKWGYVDRAGKFVIQPQYTAALPFCEGLANVRLENGSKGHIDKTGRLIVSGSDGMICDGLVTIRMKDKYAFADKTGKLLFEAPGEAWPVGGGLVAFKQNGRMGFMDRKGKVVIPPLYRCDVNWQDRQFAEKITPVSMVQADGKEKYGFIDRTGKVVVDFQYDWAEQFFDGLAKVTKDGKSGYVNTDGAEVIPLQYAAADHFAEGVAAVEIGGLWGFIDTAGRTVIQPQYLPRLWGSPMIFSEGLAAVRTETGTGFINRAGEMIIPPAYRSAEDYSGGLVLVKGQTADIYFNMQGKIVWPHGPTKPY